MACVSVLKGFVEWERRRIVGQGKDVQRKKKLEWERRQLRRLVGWEEADDNNTEEKYRAANKDRGLSAVENGRMTE